LERVRGYSFAQLGSAMEAEEAFRASLQSARDRSADFDVALALIALERLARARGEEPDPAFREESSAILIRLGVVAVAVDPLGSLAAG
jgi:hypothetical protein